LRLQNKLALATCLLIVPVIFLLVLSVDSMARNRIYASVDESLEAKALSVRGAVAVGPAGLSAEAVESSLPELDRQAARGLSFILASTDGAVLYSSAGETTGIGGDPWMSNSPEYGTLEIDDIKTRVLREPFFGLGQVLGYVEIRESLQSADEAVGDIRGALIVGGAGASVAIVLCVYWLAGHLVRPVRMISEVSSRIYAAEDFERRVPEVSSPREVRELGITLNSMLERMQAMIASQKAFLAESSHELRRPLTILRTNLDLLTTQDLPEEVRSSVEEESRAEATAMSNLVSELLILSRGELSAVEPRRVDLSRLVASSIREFREYCRDHQFEAAVSQGIAVNGDADRLKHVFDNLLENAHAYTPPSGQIVVTLVEEGESAVLRVADSGGGISQADLSHVFERFYRGNAGRESGVEGFGLGLAIVKQVVESHGGTISVASMPGQGTTFEVTLTRI
jgi:two-component system OmpR family sensor kinase